MARKLFHPDNTQTVLAVCCVMSLLAVTLNFYNFTRVQRVEAVAVRAAHKDVSGLEEALISSRKEVHALRDQVRALEDKVAGLEASRAVASASSD